DRRQGARRHGAASARRLRDDRGVRVLRDLGAARRGIRRDLEQLGSLRDDAGGVHFPASPRRFLRPMRGRRIGAALAAIALLAAACRTSSPRMVEVGGGAAGATRVVIAPMNLAVPLAQDLEDAVDPVTWELIRYFQKHSARVAVIWAPDAAALWRS